MAVTAQIRAFAQYRLEACVCELTSGEESDHVAQNSWHRRYRIVCGLSGGRAPGLEQRINYRSFY